MRRPELPQLNLTADNLALVLSGLAALISGGWLSVILSQELQSFAYAPLFYLTFLLGWMAAFGSLALVFASVMRRGSFPNDALNYGGLALLHIGLLLVQVTLPISRASDLINTMIVAVLLVGTVFIGGRQLSSFLGRRDDTSMIAVLCACASILIFNQTRRLDFIGIEAVLIRGWRDSSLVLCAHPIFFFLQNFLRGLQDSDDNVSPKTFQNLSGNARWNYLILLGSSLAGAGLAQILLSADSTPFLGSHVFWPMLSLASVPPFVWALQLWQHRSSRKAERKSQQSWIGMKTSVLLIDHDPHEECRLYLPSLLYRARQLQTEQIVRRTFARSILQQKSLGSQITLAVDPRTTASSCVEALMIISIIYIDGLGLVERRLRNLVSLLPLLDPEMADSLNSQELESLFSRLQGFFHLDYTWIDQSREDSGSPLDVRLEHLNARQRQRVLMQLSNSQWLGNFIWISEAAREQIKLESPYLMSAIERLPIKIEQTSGRTVEASIFLMKFENLIPRLQHYYNFDELRQVLSALPMRADSLSFYQHLEQDLSRSRGYHSLHTLLTEVRAHEWQGFQAKDNALGLILRVMREAAQQHRTKLLTDEDLHELEKIAREVIHLIGYPSQDFHMEHLHKLELRQVHELQRICLDREQVRFEEAWLLLSSLPGKGMELELAIRLLSILKAAGTQAELKHESLILTKSVETFFALARVLPESSESELVQILNLLAENLAGARAEPALLIAFLDKKLSLDAHRGHALRLHEDVVQMWNRLVQSHKNEPQGRLSETIVLRWNVMSQPVAEAS